MTTEEFLPAAVWPVASYVREMMVERGWNETHLAHLLGAKTGAVTLRNILSGLPLDGFHAGRLADAFGTSKQLWLNLDGTFWRLLATGSYYLAKEDKVAGVAITTALERPGSGE